MLWGSQQANAVRATASTVGGQCPCPPGAELPARPAGQRVRRNASSGRVQARTQADLHDFLLRPGGQRVQLSQSGFVQLPGRAQQGHHPQGATEGTAPEGSQDHHRPLGPLGGCAQTGRAACSRSTERRQLLVLSVEVADAGQEGQDGAAQVSCGQVVWPAGGSEREQCHRQVGDSEV